ncbi:MAG: shufflon system plasmid conjugative transfer pilus tip adhesin PilV, partial [Pseudomonadota bacterium]
MSEILGLLFAILAFTTYLPKFVQINQTSTETTIATVTAQQQLKLIAVGSTYIQQNSAALQAVATATVPAIITVPMLQAPAVKLLDSGFSSTNPYSQTWQIGVLQPSAGYLQAIVMSTGGTALTDAQAGRIAAYVGAAGGVIPQNDSGIYATGSANAVGSFGGWNIPLANYTGVAGGHLAALLSFNNGQLNSSYLYRNAVPGQPQLNTMNTPLILGGGAVQASGAACTAAELGSMARDATGNFLMCNGTIYKSQGSAYWQDPVATYTALNTSYPCNAASAWQVRVVKTPTTGTGPRAYICNGTTTTWAAISADDSGNMTIAGSLTTGKVKLTDIVTSGNRCSDNTAAAPGAADIALNGAVSRDVNGLTLSCQSGVWTKQATGGARAWV